MQAVVRKTQPSSNYKSRDLTAAAILVLFFIYSLPNFGFDYGLARGLDPSWHLILNYFSSELKNIRFGEDVIFSYGPLGYLKYPGYFYPNVILSLIFEFLVCICTSLLLLALILERKPKNVFLFLLFIPSSLLAFEFDAYLLLPVLNALAILLLKEPLAEISKWLGVVFACVYELIKFNDGLMYVALIVVAVVIRYFHDSRSVLAYLYFLLALAISYFLFYSATASFDVTDWLAYISDKWRVASGYSTYMSSEGDTSWLILSISILTLMIAVVLASFPLLLKRENMVAAGVLLVLSISMFLIYKSCIVRGDRIYIAPFSIYLFLLLLISNIKIFNDRGISAIVIVGVFLSTLISVHRMGIYDFSSLEFSTNKIKKLVEKNSISPTSFKVNSEDIYFSSETQPRKDSQFKNVTHGQSFSIFPSELSYVPEIDGDYIPLYSLQTYAAISPYIDAKTATKLAGSNVDTIFFHWDRVSGRHPFLDIPAVSKELFCKYSYFELDRKAYFFDGYFKLKEDDSCNTLQEISSVNLAIAPKVSRWIEIPSVAEPLFMSLSVDKTLLGSIINFLYKLPPVNIQLLYQDGRLRTFRAVLENYANLTLINYVPAVRAEVGLVYEKNPRVRVKAFKIAGPGAKFFTIEGGEFFTVTD